jgi:hypothetical protein
LFKTSSSYSLTPSSDWRIAFVEKPSVFGGKKILKVTVGQVTI